MSNVIDSIIDSFTDFFEKLKENKIVTLLLVALVSLYTTLYIKSLSKYTTDLFTNAYFKFILFILISYIASSNQALGIILAIAVLATLQMITYTELVSVEKEKFSPADMYQNIYMTKPLLRESELTDLGNNIDFQFETPKEYAEKMIKQGKILLDDSLELKNDNKKRFDIREQQIAEITERDGNVLVQSGINRLENSNDGEYNSWIDSDSQSQLSKMSSYNKLSDDKKSSYIKYDKFIQNYSDNEEIMGLFNLIKQKYNELTQTKSISQLDFDDKLEEIYDAEYDLLVAIAEVKMSKLDKKDADIIKGNLASVKNLRITKDKRYNLELNNLSELLCM